MFLAFKHNPRVGRITERLRGDLEGHGVYAYRAKDDPHPGWPLQQRIDTWIERADGTVIFWSGQGSKSPAVRLEYETAKKFGRRRCLVKFPDVGVPTDWGGDEWLELQGVRFNIFGIVFVNPPYNPQWSRFVEIVAKFAHEARAERQGKPPGPK